MGKRLSYELQSWKKSFKRDWHLYLLLLVPLALVIIFNYFASSLVIFKKKEKE
jgi:ABC-type polysaccharide transport system permease subunit